MIINLVATSEPPAPYQSLMDTLHDLKISRTEAARAIGISVTHFNAVLRGTYFPSSSLKRRIEAYEQHLLAYELRSLTPHIIL